MGKEDLQARLDNIKVRKVDLNPVDTKLVKILYNVDIEATEKQMDHLKGHMRMLKIKFQVREA